MNLPLPYMLPALDGSSAERAAVLQEIRDRGIVEASDLVAFCFKVEALLDIAETRELELMQDLIEARRGKTSTTDIEEIRETVANGFADLSELLPKHSDLIYNKCTETLRSLI